MSRAVAIITSPYKSIPFSHYKFIEMNQCFLSIIHNDQAI